MKWVGLLGAAAVAMAASPASAALFVSGDSNIFDFIATSDPNQAFLENMVEGSNVLIRGSTRTFAFGSIATNVETYLDGAGYSASQITPVSAVTAADLAGMDLFIAFATNQAFSAAETTAIADFLAGGGNVLVTAENDFFPELNMQVNDLLIGLGSGMRVVDARIEAGFNPAQIITANAYTAGADGLLFAATSKVTGGTALFGTTTDNVPFIAVETGAIPEPATWALMIAGFGFAGAALRRQVCRVA